MTKKYVHFMVDVETLSTEPNAVVLSIGALRFNPMSGQVLGSFHVKLNLTEQRNRHISADTVQWWVNQLKEKNGFELFSENNRTMVRNALIALREFMDDIGVDDKRVVWACDPDFDCVILENLFNEYGFKVPWRYTEPKSVRTVRLLAELTGVKLPDTKATHNAIEDCERQAMEVSTFIRKSKGIV